MRLSLGVAVTCILRILAATRVTDNRLVYFDVNDYDEAALAPVTWDMIRLVTSIQCGADALNATHAETLAVSQSCLNAYRSALINGACCAAGALSVSGKVQFNC